MFVRIVKMTFDSNKIEIFLKNFNDNKQNIRNFEGCRLLELYRDKTNTSIFFTYSYWENEAALENYKNSTLFKNIWAKTKIYFVEKPEAWSVNKLESLQ